VSGGPAPVAYGPSPDQFGELWLPSGQRQPGTVVVIHGGFWRARYDVALGRPLAADLAARGYVVWNLEYRRVGAGGGWPATFADAAAGVDRLGDLDVDTSAVTAIGHSAGGHLAAWLAGRDRLPEQAPGGPPRVTVTAVVAQAGVLALVEAAERSVGAGAVPDLMGGLPGAVPARYRIGDPLASAPLARPVLCVHGRDDESVPFEQSIRYVEASAGGAARLVEVTGGHMAHIDTDNLAWTVVVDALPELLSS
jgi:acetyl esterase/lipase